VKLFRRPAGVPAEVLARAGLPRGEKVLAHADAGEGSWLLGTRIHLVIVQSVPADVVRIPWEQIEDAAWDQETSRFQVTETGSWGAQRPAYAFVLEDPPLLLQLVRERVTASIVLQRRVPVRGKLGLTVIGRRSPVGGPVAWMHAYDVGLDPDDPEVAAAADTALVGARAEVGDEGRGPI
jgi:hypothetical protein